MLEIAIQFLYSRLALHLDLNNAQRQNQMKKCA